MATRYILLPIAENGVPQKPIVQDSEPTLEQLQKLVGGNIEYCPMPQDAGFEIIVNEEGRIRGFSTNYTASNVYGATWLSKHDKSELSLQRLTLVGPVVVVYIEEKE